MDHPKHPAGCSVCETVMLCNIAIKFNNNFPVLKIFRNEKFITSDDIHLELPPQLIEIAMNSYIKHMGSFAKLTKCIPPDFGEIQNSTTHINRQKSVESTGEMYGIIGTKVQCSRKIQTSRLSESSILGFGQTVQGCSECEK